jgi:predicted ArsR family transcriptional regulator/DNA-binding transcriptional ArsR family regulator
VETQSPESGSVRNILPPEWCQGNSQDQYPLHAALAYASRGHEVLACKPWPEKAPHYIRGLLERGHLDATDEDRKIEAMFARYPDASLGLRLERVVVIDVESKKGHGVDGFPSLRELERRYGTLPGTWVNATPSGGEHRLYRAPEGMRLTNRTGDSAIAPGVEFKATGYVLVPPSPGYSVKDRRRVAELPAEWAELLAEPTSRESSKPSKRSCDTLVSIGLAGPEIPERQRNTVLTSLCGKLHDGSRNLQQLTDALKTIRDTRCENPRNFPDTEVEKIARSIYQREPCNPARKVETPEVTRRIREVSEYWYREHLAGGGRSKLRDTYRACCISAVKRKELRTITFQDGGEAEVLVFSESTRQLAEIVRTSHISVSKHLHRLEEMGALVALERRVGLSPTYALLLPAQKVNTLHPRPAAPEGEAVGEGVNLRRVDELETPMFGWRSPVGNSGGGVLVALEVFGFQSGEELARRLGISRVRDLERRQLEPLERMGLVERHEGLWGRPKDFRKRDKMALGERYTTVFRRRERRRTAEGRKVCELIEIVRTESELERDWARHEQHTQQRRKFEDRRQKALEESLEADQGCRDLLNRWDEELEADGYIGELEQIDLPKPEPEKPELSDLAITLRDYLERYPKRARETPSWIANTLWAYELVEGKPAQYHVAAALDELSAAQERKDAA